MENCIKCKLWNYFHFYWNNQTYLEFHRISILGLAVPFKSHLFIKYFRYIHQSLLLPWTKLMQHTAANILKISMLYGIVEEFLFHKYFVYRRKKTLPTMLLRSWVLCKKVLLSRVSYLFLNVEDNVTKVDVIRF